MSIRATALAHALADACPTKGDSPIAKRVGQNIRVGVGIMPVRHHVKMTEHSALKFLGQELGNLARLANKSH